MGILEQIADLLFPPKCTNCGRIGAFICADCATKIVSIKKQICPVCNKISEGGKTCSRCRPKVGLSGVIACAYFKDPVVKNLVHAFKYEKVAAAGPCLSERMIFALKADVPKFDLIVPVPISKKRQSWRGFNQSEILAAAISKELSYPLFLGLKKVKNTKTQVGLTSKQRQQNLEGAFICKNPKQIRGKRILLVDDVITTGATLDSCARTLKQAGARSVYGLVFAKE